MHSADYYLNRILSNMAKATVILATCPQFMEKSYRKLTLATLYLSYLS